MARLVVIIHSYDRFTHDKRGGGVVSNYLLYDVLKELESLGHSWCTSTARDPQEGDAALLHVDSTVVEERYLALGSRYARTINFGTGDISKRRVSRLILAPGEEWAGAVIVKSNANNRAVMEDLHNSIARKLGRPLPHPKAVKTGRYLVYDSVAEVPEEVWQDSHLIVERFLPEPEGKQGYALRSWVFMGPRERCNRLVTAGPISKAAGVISIDPVEVPEKLRAERARLGFDFGKFDFVMHDGEPMLFDANRTPGVGQTIQQMLKAGARNLAEGLDALLTGAA